MSEEKAINLKVPQDLYDGAKEILDANYVPTNTAIKMYLAEIKRTRRIPVDTKIAAKAETTDWPYSPHTHQRYFTILDGGPRHGKQLYIQAYCLPHDMQKTYSQITPYYLDSRLLPLDEKELDPLKRALDPHNLRNHGDKIVVLNNLSFDRHPGNKDKVRELINNPKIRKIYFDVSSNDEPTIVTDLTAMIDDMFKETNRDGQTTIQDRVDPKLFTGLATIDHDDDRYGQFKVITIHN